MGVYADISSRLIEQGFAAIPIMPGTKRPGMMCEGQWLGLSNWQRRFNRGAPPDEVLARWCVGDTGAGVIMGQPSGGAVAVDIDTDDLKILMALRSILPPTPVKKRGQKGETRFYFGPAITKSKTWKIDNKTVVDLIGPGRQTVLPPTTHPDTGRPYVWTGTETLEDVMPSELPELTPDMLDRIAEALTPFGCEILDELSPRASNGTDDDTPHRQLNNAALQNLSAWVPSLELYRCRRTRRGYEAVPAWRPSTTGRAREERKLNLKIVPTGIKDFGADQGYTPLDLVMTVRDCELEDAWQFLSEKLGFVDGAAINIEALVGMAVETAEAPSDVETETPAPEPSTEAPAEPATPTPAEPLEAYTHCPGAVGNIVDWITATARRPNRVLALAAAVTIVGTLVGRRVAGPTRSATHLYAIGVGPTGIGKQHLQDSVMALMRAANAMGHVGPSEFISMPAVLSLLNRKPLVLCIQDEFGAFLKRLAHKRASGFEVAISKILRSLWSASFVPLATPEWANREMQIIQSPAVSILGLTTSDEFYGALQNEIDNGFLNRLLAFGSDARALEREPEKAPDKVPSGLSASLKALHVWRGPHTLLRIHDPQIVFIPDVLPWASEQAEDCYFDFLQACEREVARYPGLRSYVARMGEIAVRLATIRAAGRWGPGASVDISDMEWGAGISWTTGWAMANAAAEYTPQNERRTWADKILAMIEHRGAMKVRDIQMYIRGALKSADIKDLLKQFVEAGLVEWTSDGYRTKKPD